MPIEPTGLQILWYLLIAVLWLGYLVLEGFDYGVAMLVPVLGKTEKDRRVMINTIGPVWDGNEVWLLTAGGATFAAFPGWYATLFSGLYLPLFLILFGLIIRGVSFEYRAKRPGTPWRRTFDFMAALGSFVVALVFGVGFANFIIGLPVDTSPVAPSLHVFTGTLLSLFSPFGILGGIVLVALFLFHGSIFLALKTKGEIHERAKSFALKIGIVTLLGGAAFLVWQNLSYGPGGVTGWLLVAVAALSLIWAYLSVRQERDGRAFFASMVATAAIAIGIFVQMFPNLGFDNAATLDKPLNVVTASSSPMTLTIMTVAAVVFVPIVIGYQAWSYWVFRRRVSVANIPDDVAYEPVAG